MYSFLLEKVLYSIELYCLVFWYSADDVLPISRGRLCSFFSNPAGCNGPQHLAEQFTPLSSLSAFPFAFLSLCHICLGLSANETIKSRENHVKIFARYF